MKPRRPITAVAATGPVAVPAACGGNSDADEGTTDKYAEAGQAGLTKVPDAQGPAPEVEGAQKGGTITVLHPAPDHGPESLDPTRGWSVTDNGILQQLAFRSLTTYRMNQETGEMELVPDLATDLGTHNEDYTVWTFTIKDGIKWENGQPVTAEDIAFGIKRSFDTTNLSGPGAEYSKSYFLEGDKYDGPYVDGENYEGVVVDGNTITIKMGKSFAEMDFWGAFMAMGPVPSGDAGKPPTYGFAPLATGPYKVESFTPKHELVLVRNDQWDPSTDPARHQYVDTWIMKFDQFQETTDELMLSNSEESKTTINTATSGWRYQAMRDAVGERVVAGPRACASFWYPEPDEIKEIEVRQALAFAYPYEDTWAAGGAVPGVTRIMGSTIMPPGMLGRQEYDPIPGEPIRYDPEKAKELLAKVGYEPGEYEISWAYDTSSEGVAAMKRISMGLEESGFKPKPYGYGGGSLYDVWADPDNDIHQKLNVQGVTWISDWASGSTFIPPLFQTGQMFNTGGFSEKSVDDQIKEIAKLPADEQADAWGALDKEIMTKYFPVINVGYQNNLYTYGENIGNFRNDSAAGYPNLRDMYVVQ